MTWALVFDPAAKKDLAKLDKAIQRAVKSFLTEVCKLQDPASRGHALTGPWAGFHRYRVGQLRIIVKIHRQQITITVLVVDRRDSIY